MPFCVAYRWQDPYVYATKDGVVHAVLHDEQITRCADGPVGCWPGGFLSLSAFPKYLVASATAKGFGC
jgi:hypothetical protein